MSLRTYIISIALLSLLGLCTVYEVMGQTRVKYDLGRYVQREQVLCREVEKLRADLAGLMTPRRLEAINREKGLGLVPLKPISPLEPELPVAFDSE